MNAVASRIIVLSEAPIRTWRQSVMPVGKSSRVRHSAQKIYVLLRNKEIHSVYRIWSRRIAVIVQNGHGSRRGSAQTYAYGVTQRDIESLSPFHQGIIYDRDIEGLCSRLSGGPTQRSYTGGIVTSFTRFAGDLRTGSVQGRI